MTTLKSRLAVLVLAAGAAAPAALADLKSYTFVNRTGVDANDFHIRFDRNANPPTVAPAPTNHSNSIQDPNGGNRGTFPRPAASGSNPPGGLTTNQLDYTMPSATVRNNDSLTIVVPFPRFPRPGFGTPQAYWFTLNGQQIAGQVDRVAMLEDFRQDPVSGVVSLNLDAEAGAPAVQLSNIRVWTDLTEAQMDDYLNLSPGAATSLGSASVAPGMPASFSLGNVSTLLYGVVKYDVSYYDPGILQQRTIQDVTYGAQVPAPGTVALALLGLAIGVRRRR